MTITINGTTGISGVDGSAGTPSLQGQDTNTGFFYGTDILGFSTGGSERMRIDASGNLGLGVTPSAWGTTNSLRAIEMAGGSLWGYSTTAMSINQNAYLDGTNYIYKTNAAATRYTQLTGTHLWYTAPSGTAGNAISFTQAMTLDASGNLGIGTSSPSVPLDVNGNIWNAYSKFEGIVELNARQTGNRYSLIDFHGDDTYTDYGLRIGRNNSGANTESIINHRGTGYLDLFCNEAATIRFGTSNTERMRIDSSGNVSVNITGAYANLTVNNTASGSIGNALWLSNSSGVSGSGAALAFGFQNNIKHRIACGTFGSDYMSLQTWNGSTVTERMKLDATDVTTYSNNFYATTSSGGGMFKVMSGGGDVFQAYQNRNGTSPYFYFNTSGTYGVFSDSRLKDDIVPLSGNDAVSFVMGLDPVEFNWKEQYGNAEKRISGFLAQDALAAAVTEGQKNALTNWETYDENDPDCDFLGLSEQRILPSVVGALKVALSQIAELKAELDATKAEVAALKGAK